MQINFPLNSTSSGTDFQKRAKLFSSNSTKLEAIANSYLSKINNGQPLRHQQKLHLKIWSKEIPLARMILEKAYRDYHSGDVLLEVLEPEIEKLKEQGMQEFAAKADKKTYFQRAGAAKLDLLNIKDEDYQSHGISSKELHTMRASICDEISLSDQKLLKIDPDEILDSLLGYRHGQALSLFGEREHLPNLIEIAKAAIQRSPAKINIKITEHSEYDPVIPFVKFADQSVLNEVDISHINFCKERLEEQTASFGFSGANPQQYATFSKADSERHAAMQSKQNSQVENYNAQLIQTSPWSYCYSPTPISAQAAGYSNFHDAAREAKAITRAGGLNSHIKKMNSIAEKMNNLVKDGYTELHFVSMKPASEEADGQTDLRIGLSPKSRFLGPAETTPSGQRYVPNLPSEEVFTTPDHRLTDGQVKTTIPLSLNGQLVEGITFSFAKGKLKWAKAESNDHILQSWLQNFRGVDKLGEVALVADSPIAKTKRVFQDVLLDENASCHIALGRCYPEAIDGAMDISDYNEQTKFVSAQGGNVDANNHVDFMIGAKNVMVWASKPGKNNDKVLLIKDDQWSPALS